MDKEEEPRIAVVWVKDPDALFKKLKKIFPEAPVIENKRSIKNDDDI